MAQSPWRSDLTELKPTSDQVCAWLTKPYILSKALKRVSESLIVDVLEQRFTDAIEDEYAILAMPSSTIPFVRQVFLIGDNQQPLTYGRVIIPPATYDAHFQDFEKLGGKLIGETLLYHNPDVVRSGFEYACLDKADPRCAFVYQQLPTLPHDPLWARRSVLVTELFLPFLPAFIPGNEDAV